MENDRDISHYPKAEIDRLLLSLDGFSFQPGKMEYKILHQLVNYDGPASTASQMNEASSRFKRNVQFYFRGLQFFQEFHGHRGFPRGVPGFWGLIQQQVGNGTLFTSEHHAKRFVKFLISSRDKFLEWHPHYTSSQSDDFSEDLQRLTLHWSTLMSNIPIASQRPKLSQDDLSKLAERCAEWGRLVESGRLADPESPLMSEAGGKTPERGCETPRTNDDTPMSVDTPGSEHRFAGFDKRLMVCLKLQLQQGTEISSHASRLQNTSSQMSKMAAEIADLRAKVAENDAVQEQLKLAVDEFLQAELPNQLESKLKELVTDAINRIPLQNKIRTAVSAEVKKNHVHRRVQDLEQQFNNQSHSRFSPTTQAHPSEGANAFHHTQHAAPSHNNNQIHSDKAREELIINQHRAIREQAEKIDRLEREQAEKMKSLERLERLEREQAQEIERLERERAETIERLERERAENIWSRERQPRHLGPQDTPSPLFIKREPQTPTPLRYRIP